MVEDESDSRSPLSAELRRWVGAGLLSDDQAEAITLFERERTRANSSGRATRAIALLGALTLVCGIGSLIAYNWGRFGGTARLVGMAVLLLAAFAFNLRARQKQTRSMSNAAAMSGATAVSTALDVSLLVTSGCTLAALALVSQVYDQDGELWQLLFVWSGLTVPLMLFARTRFAHVFWAIGLGVSLLSSCSAFDDFLHDANLMRNDQEFAVGILYVALGALVSARFAASEFKGRRAVGLGLYHLHLVGVGLFGGLVWLDGESSSPILWGLGLASLLALALATPNSVEHIGFGSRKHVVGLFGLGILLSIIPMGLPVESGVAAFVSFVLFWAAAWALAEKAGHIANARFAVFALGIRIVIASFELFENLFLTGIVLVGMGCAAIAWSRYKWNVTTGGGHRE